MHNKILILLLFTVFTFVKLNAQPSPKAEMPKKLKIIGVLIDAEANKPLAYSSVVLYSQKDNELITGAISNEQGDFEISDVGPGKYFIIIRSVGYKDDTISNVIMRPDTPLKDLGKIMIHRASEELSAVEVVAEKTFVEYKIDRKVVNVGKDITSKGGTAVEALENVPSINVTIDDEVELRGSSSFTVLINGKPSPLSGSDALNQIPVSQVKRVEIITNPSAKYDPEGTTGIINVVLKDNIISGISGLVEAGIGSYDRYNADAILSYRNEKFNVFVSGDYRTGKGPGEGSFFQESYFDDTLYRNTKVNRTRHRNHYSAKVGFDYYLNKKNTLGITADFSNREHSRDYSSTVHDYSSNPAFIDEYALNESVKSRGGPSYATTLRWDHDFNKKGHKLMAYAYYDWSSDYDNDFQLEYYTNEDFIKTDQIISGIDTEEKDNDDMLNIKVEYENPFKKNQKFEAGGEIKLDGFVSTYTLQEYDTTAENWLTNEDFSTTLTFNRDIYAAYAIYSGEKKTFGYQIGLRGEFVDRFTIDENDNKDAEMQKFSLFPTLHFSKSFKKGHKVLLSYSRRIRRPNGWYLEPFPTYISSTFIREGNPNLKPEYVDNYELSYQKMLGKSFIALEGFYRVGKDKITRLKTVNEDNIAIMTFANIDDDQSLGLELMFKLNLTKWFDANLSGSFYNYKIQGEYDDYSYNRESNNYNLRTKLNFRLFKKLRWEISGFYNGPSVTATGSRKAWWMMSSGLSYSMLDDKLSLTFRVRDIFDSMKWEMTNYGTNFISVDKFNRAGQMLNFSVSYKINNYKQKRSSGNMNGGQGGDDFI